MKKLLLILTATLAYSQAVPAQSKFFNITNLALGATSAYLLYNASRLTGNSAKISAGLGVLAGAYAMYNAYQAWNRRTNIQKAVPAKDNVWRSNVRDIPFNDIHQHGNISEQEIATMLAAVPADATYAIGAKATLLAEDLRSPFRDLITHTALIVFYRIDNQWKAKMSEWGILESFPPQLRYYTDRFTDLKINNYSDSISTVFITGAGTFNFDFVTKRKDTAYNWTGAWTGASKTEFNETDHTIVGLFTASKMINK